MVEMGERFSDIGWTLDDSTDFECDMADESIRFCCPEMMAAFRSGFVRISDGIAMYGGSDGKSCTVSDGSKYICSEERGITASRCLYCGSRLFTASFGRGFQ